MDNYLGGESSGAKRVWDDRNFTLDDNMEIENIEVLKNSS